MSRVLLALEAYQRDVTPTLGEHALCGRPTLSVGTIGGGVSVNTVPDLATIEIDRRLLPGEDPRAPIGRPWSILSQATRRFAASSMSRR